MKGLLRSVIDLEGGIAQENLIQNFQKLCASKIEWTQPADQRVFDFLKMFFHQRFELPSKQVLSDFFDAKKDYEAVERLKDFEGVTPYIKGNYAHLLATLVEEQNKVRALLFLKEAQEIITKGLLIDDEKKQGLRDGILHFTQKAHSLLVSDHSSIIEGNLVEDGQAVWEEYQQAKADKALAWGKFTGLNNIDRIIKGIRRGELWIHAAYTGGLKTTFALNWALNLVTRYRTNVYYVTLEMPYEQIRKRIYAMHSENAKFLAMGYQPLDYEKLKSGSLSDEEEAFLQVVIKDFCTNEDYGSFDVWGPDEEVTIEDIKVKAEILHQKSELGLLIIDHGLLVEPRKKKRSKDYSTEMNSVLRDTKKLALHFNHGEKIPVLMLFQINREGMKQAEKAEGRYQLNALSYASEAERSADVITTTYLNDEHRKAGTTLFDCLKRRDGAPFEPFIARVHWPTMRILNHDIFHGSNDSGLSVDDGRNVQDMMFNL
jgi:replicative DNA helicase